MFDDAKSKMFRVSLGWFTELEDRVYLWIDGMRRANLHVLLSLAITKAKLIASSLAKLEEEFKASWQWLSRIRACPGLQKLHKGGEVNKDDPELLTALSELVMD